MLSFVGLLVIGVGLVVMGVVFGIGCIGGLVMESIVC